TKSRSFEGTRSNASPVSAVRVILASSVASSRRRICSCAACALPGSAHMAITHASPSSTPSSSTRGCSALCGSAGSWVVRPSISASRGRSDDIIENRRSAARFSALVRLSLMMLRYHIVWNVDERSSCGVEASRVVVRGLRDLCQYASLDPPIWRVLRGNWCHRALRAVVAYAYGALLKTGDCNAWKKEGKMRWNRSRFSLWVIGVGAALILGGCQEEKSARTTGLSDDCGDLPAPSTLQLTIQDGAYLDALGR